MAPRFLLDTNTFIYIRQRRPLEIRRRFEAMEFGETTVSVITYGELMFGVEKSATQSKSFAEVEEIVALIPVLPLPATAGPIYGSIRAALAAKGRIIGSNDLWIAAHAIAQDLTVVTSNEREFRRVSGLKVENWMVH